MNHSLSILFLYIKKHMPALWWVFLLFLITWFWRFSPDRTVFLLDYVPTPLYERDWYHQLQQSWIRFLHNLLIYLLWYVWWSKIYLFSIFLCSLYLWYLRWNRINAYTSKKITLWIQYSVIMFCMTLFVANPFFSARFWTQPWIWLSILLLWWGLYYIISRWWTRDNSDYIVIWWLLWASIMSMMHASFIVLLLLLAWCILYRKKIVWFSIVFIIVLLLNSNWLLLTSSKTQATIETFSDQNITEFATYSHEPRWVRWTTLLGYGFWWEKYGSAYTPHLSNQQWWIAWMFILMFALYWMRFYNKKNKVWALFLLLLIIFALVLWIWIASPLTAWVTTFLYDTLPWYRGFREPQKWIWLYIIIILPLVALWRSQSIWWIKKQFWLPLWVYFCASVSLIFARTPWVLANMKWRYTMINYPWAYNNARTYMVQNQSLLTKQRIHLPWHSYHQCDWTNKVIANSLSHYFFPVWVIVWDNIEIGQLYTNSTNKRSQSIEQFLATKDILFLKKHAIGWIIFTKKCGDFVNYQWLTTHSWLKEIWSNEDISLFLVQ